MEYSLTRYRKRYEKKKKKRSKTMLFMFAPFMAATVFMISFLPTEAKKPPEIKVNASEQPVCFVYDTQRAELPTESCEKENWQMYTATAYCPCEICCGEYAENRPIDEYGNEIVYTASGKEAEQGKTIAADWSILPCGTIVEVKGYGTYEVQDNGGLINGNKIDVYFNDHQDAVEFGVKTVRIKIVKKGDV